MGVCKVRQQVGRQIDLDGQRLSKKGLIVIQCQEDLVGERSPYLLLLFCFYEQHLCISGSKLCVKWSYYCRSRTVLI